MCQEEEKVLSEEDKKIQAEGRKYKEAHVSMVPGPFRYGSDVSYRPSLKPASGLFSTQIRKFRASS